MTEKRCVLVVEDEFLIADMLAEMVVDMGYEVCGIADTAALAVELALQACPMAILMDVRLKGTKDGIDAALEIRKSIDCPVIFVTGSQEPATVTRIKQDHPAAVLFKPVDFRLLESAIRNVVA